MRAKIVDNLLETIDNFFEGNEGHRQDAKFLQLCERIQGKDVDIVFVCGDAFEKEDKDYWLPSCCWTELKQA